MMWELLLFLATALSRGDGVPSTARARQPDDAADAKAELVRLKRSLHSDDVEGHFQLALRADGMGLRAEANRLLRLVLERDPWHPAAHWMLGTEGGRHDPTDPARWPLWFAYGLRRLHPIELDVESVPGSEVASGSGSGPGSTGTHRLVAYGLDPAPVLLLVAVRRRPEQEATRSDAADARDHLLLEPLVAIPLDASRGRLAYTPVLPADPVLTFAPELCFQLLQGGGTSVRTSGGVVWRQHRVVAP